MPRPLLRVVAPSLVASVAVLVACAASGCASRSSATASPARAEPAVRLADVDFVQFRWEAPTALASRGYVDPSSGRPVALNDSVVLDIRGIDSAWTWHPRGDTVQWDVDLLLSRSGAARFGATTATHVGQRLAILVDGAITQMPIIQSALGAHVVLVTRVSRPVADSLAARVNHAVAALRPFQPAMFPRDIRRTGTRSP